MAALDELWTPAGRRRPGRADRHDRGHVGPDPEFSLEQTELNEALAEAIARLPEREKLVVTLYYYEELTLREIGEVLGVTESRVSQLHTKAVLRLKARLSGGVRAATADSLASCASAGPRPRASSAPSRGRRPRPRSSGSPSDASASTIDWPASISASPSASPDSPTATVPPQRPSGDVSAVVSTRRAPAGTSIGCGAASSVPSSREIASQCGARATAIVTVEPSGARVPGDGRTPRIVPGSTSCSGRSSTTGVKPASRSACEASSASSPSSDGHGALRRAGRDDERDARRALELRARRRVGLDRVPGLDLGRRRVAPRRREAVALEQREGGRALEPGDGRDVGVGAPRLTDTSRAPFSGIRFPSGGSCAMIAPAGRRLGVRAVDDLDLRHGELVVAGALRDVGARGRDPLPTTSGALDARPGRRSRPRRPRRPASPIAPTSGEERGRQPASPTARCARLRAGARCTIVAGSRRIRVTSVGGGQRSRWTTCGVRRARGDPAARPGRRREPWPSRWRRRGPPGRGRAGGRRRRRRRAAHPARRPRATAPASWARRRPVASRSSPSNGIRPARSRKRMQPSA